MKDIQPQIGSKTPRGNGLAIAVEVAIIAAHMTASITSLTTWGGSGSIGGPPS